MFLLNDVKHGKLDVAVVLMCYLQILYCLFSRLVSLSNLCVLHVILVFLMSKLGEFHEFCIVRNSQYSPTMVS